MLSGRWTYRSYRNLEKLVGQDQQAALALIFGEGVFELHQSDDGSIEGGLGMENGYALRMTGSLGTAGNGLDFTLSGEGLDGTATAGWRYDYRGVVGHMWRDAVAQVPSLLGTVVRVKAHGPDAPAGFTASFIAVRHSDNQPPRTARPLSSLMR
ncbi:MAG TPA: hypothetical protein VMB73_28155 [Acetobacteraceae bacterium]|jgi:hypothetical protein|nr:hypothetical protein [Acetobacteraceae bacterium]